MSQYTVHVENTLLGKQRFEGTFDSYGEAEAHARAEADRSRAFAIFQVWQGTPKRANKAVGPKFKGTE